MKRVYDLSLKYMRNYKYFSRLTEEDEEQLKSVGISPNTLPDCVYSIDCICGNKLRHGIGVRNVKGGVEFINFDNMQDATTIKNCGISIIPASSDKSEDCCVFFSLRDYLVYNTLSLSCDTRLPTDCDALLLSSSCNIIDLIVESEDYERVYTFLPNDDLGTIISKTMKQRNPMNVINYEFIYEPYKTLTEYAKIVSLNQNK